MDDAGRDLLPHLIPEAVCERRAVGCRLSEHRGTGRHPEIEKTHRYTLTM